MSRRNENLKIFSCICLVGVIAFGLVTIIVSCGGGGGSGNGSSSGLTYTGLETRASISDGDAQALVTGAYTNGSTGYSMSTIAALQTGDNEQTGYPVLLKISNILTDSLEQVDFSANTGGEGSRGTANVVVEGDCGGTGAYNIAFNDGTGEFTGSFTFSNFCNQGTTITGGVTFSGTVDINNNNALLSFSFSFVALTVSSPGDSLTLGGSLSINTIGSPSTLTLDVFVRYNTDGNPVYWVRNYTLIVTEGSDYVDLNISGQFYDPAEGYVTVSTETTIRVHEVYDYPSNGVLVITGAGNTKAKLTFLSPTTYMVEADTNGDDVYDYDSGVLNWT